MAVQTNPDDPIIRGNAHTMRLHGVVDADKVPVNMVGWTITWFLRLTADGAQLLAKAGTVTGTYSATPSSNTQVAEATVTAAESEALATGTHYYSWKRLTVDADLSFGQIEVVRTASR